MSQMIALKENKEFRRAYGRGKSVAGPLLVTYVCKSRLPVCRYGITASKKIGKAVQRNRARRVIREAFRIFYDRMPPHCDIVFVARGKTVYAKSTEIAAVMEKQLTSLGLLCRKLSEHSRCPDEKEAAHKT